MLAYVFWHRPASGVVPGAYEQSLRRFHRSLAHRPPAGFRSSVTLQAPVLPWLPVPAGEDAAGYEDWYLLDSWDAVGVLESAAVSHGHATAHEQVARHVGAGTASIYRLQEGRAMPAQAHAIAWVERAAGSAHGSISDLLEDGMDGDSSSLWRRCLVLGPAPELCLLSGERQIDLETGISPSRLPGGWSAEVAAREPLEDSTAGELEQPIGDG
jgi:hypothetical protein